MSVRSDYALTTDAAWLRTQGLSVGVDLSPAMTGFPGFRLGNFTGSHNTAPWDCTVCANGLFYNQSMTAITDVMRKSSLLGARDVVITLHTMPELGPDADTVKAMMVRYFFLSVR